MKKILLSLFTFASAAGIGFAQNQDYTITDLNGVEYENNSVHIYNVHGTFDDPVDEAKMHLVITNNNADPIYVTAQVVEITNTDGTLAQFCIGGPSGNCFNPIMQGSFYPNAQGGIIEPGFTWGNFDYLINLDPTNLSEYKLRFVQTDGSGNETPDTDFFLTYRYDETMSTADINTVAIAEVYPTVAKGFTTVNLKENAQVQILNMQGKVVKSLNLNSGESTLNLNGLSSGVYMVQFKGTSGTTTTTKVIVK